LFIYVTAAALEGTCINLATGESNYDELKCVVSFKSDKAELTVLH